jgi:glc operon protein GlcG
MYKSITCGVAAALAFTFAGSASAQAYGAPISLDAAKKAVTASMAESKKNNWTMAVAVVDPGGALIYFERQDATQNGSAGVAVDKAVSAATYKRPTKVFEDIVSGGGNGLRILGLKGAVPIEGGIPIVMDGKVVGAIGASGGSAQQDGMVAKAGLEALK